MPSQPQQPSENAGTSPSSSPSASVPAVSMPGLPFNVDPKKMLWWGGLGALAAVGMIEWPVAAVVGAGSWLAERWARDDARRAAEQRP